MSLTENHHVELVEAFRRVVCEICCIALAYPSPFLCFLLASCRFRSASLFEETDKFATEIVFGENFHFLLEPYLPYNMVNP